MASYIRYIWPNAGGLECVVPHCKDDVVYEIWDKLYCKEHSKEVIGFSEAAIKETNRFVSSQPMSIPNNDIPIYELVKKDIDDYAEYGIVKYLIPLQANNGRDALIDTYQELLAASQYIRQLLREKYGE